MDNMVKVRAEYVNLSVRATLSAAAKKPMPWRPSQRQRMCPAAEPAPSPAPAPIAVISEPRTMATTYYAFDNAALTPQAKEQLRQAAEKIKSVPNARITAIGHTGSTGSKEYNQRLSERRARSAAQYLKMQGVPDVKVLGKGKSNPKTSNATREGRAQNRRVEIFLHEEQY